MAQDFINVTNLKKWLNEQSREVGLAWAKGWLTKRKENKGLVYAPSQAELRTLCAPSMAYYESVAAIDGGYFGVTKALGFKPRYQKLGRILVEFYSNPLIIQDTREQDPIKVGSNMRVEALDVGDYAMAAPWDKGIRIERKSLSDFCGTLSGRKQLRKGKTKTTEWSNLERFERELVRATEQGLYVVMMVEASIADAQRFNFLPQTKWVKASPAYIMKNLRDLLARYPLSFQVVFVDGRKEMAAKMMRVLELGTLAKTMDLQFELEEGRL